MYITGKGSTKGEGERQGSIYIYIHRRDQFTIINMSHTSLLK